MFGKRIFLSHFQGEECGTAILTVLAYTSNVFSVNLAQLFVSRKTKDYFYKVLKRKQLSSGITTGGG